MNRARKYRRAILPADQGKETHRSFCTFSETPSDEFIQTILAQVGEHGRRIVTWKYQSFKETIGPMRWCGTLEMEWVYET